MPTREDLQILQSQDLELKIALTKQRIREWVTEFSSQGVYVSFSGGKDSTVLLHLVRELYPDVEAVFVNTGLEFPEIQKFAKSFDNVKVLYPEINFRQVISEHGYPMLGKDISKKIAAARNGKEWALKFLEGRAEYKGELSRFNIKKYLPLLSVDFKVSNKCCDITKKNPIHKYEKETGKLPIVATMASESKIRTTAWLRTGCNSFDSKNQISKPMSFWTEQDVLRYIKLNDIKIADVYGFVAADKDGQQAFGDCDCKLCTTGCERTGCIFCGFGAHLEKGEGRFQRLKRTHPKQYDFCINGGGYDENGIWKPNEKGLGMGHVFDELNKLYGESFIKYK